MSQVSGSPSLRIFLSSTYEDLKAYVHAAEEVLSECVEVDHFKDWEATGRPSVSVCRDRVRACHALVVLVGKTYGWIPGVEEGGDGRTSITRFEVQWARKKLMPVLPFFIQDPSQVATDLSPDAARLQSEFVAELQSMHGTPVSSLEILREALRESIAALAEKFPGEMGFSGPTRVGLPNQGLYNEFLDREESRHRLWSILAAGPSRGAVIVGRGGLGKSALANWVIDRLQSDRVIKQVIYLDPASAEPVEYVLFRSTMEASGRPKDFYEGSWAALNADNQALIEALLEVYRQRDILLMFDAFEHHLDDKTGAIRSPLVRAFVKAFVESDHSSKLLITTRQFPLLSTTEAAALQEILLDRGLPLEAGVSLLMSQLPAGDVQREQIEAAIEAVDGIPFALERMASLLRSNRLLELRDQVVHERTLDAFVALTHSTLSSDAHLTLQARAVFNEDVPIDALKHVLAGLLNPPAVESAVEELGRGHFLFRIRPALLGVHDLDREASYRSIESDGSVDRKQLHARAADHYARLCKDREYWFQWTSYDELRNDLKRFHHLVKAEQPLAAADAFSFSKVDFLSSSGHVRETADMFGGLDLGGEETRALLMKRYVLAHHLAIVGPFEDAIPKLRDVIELARTLGEKHAELSAMYELGTAYRYTGQYEDAVQLHESLTERLRESGADELLAYYLYGHSLACSYAGLYAEAIRLGQEQVRHGRRSGRSEFKARGNSSLCLPYYVIGMASEAAACAAASAEQFANTPKEHLLGFIKNVHGLALHALGRWTEAVDAFSRGRESSRESRRRRAGGLIAVNWGWALYDRGDLVGALSQIHDAIRAFEGISEADARLSHNLREAFEYAQEGNRRYEAEALWNFVSSDYVNPDLIRRVAVAERILSLEGRVPSHTRQLAQAYVDETSSTLTGLRAELDT